LCGIIKCGTRLCGIMEERKDVRQRCPQERDKRMAKLEIRDERCRRPQVALGTVEVGGFFEYEGSVFRKIDTATSSVGPLGITAVAQATGHQSYFSSRHDNTMVTPVDAVLTLVR